MLPFLRVILDRLPGGLWLILLISVMFYSITSYGCCALKHMRGGGWCTHATVSRCMSEGNLSGYSLPSNLFETGPVVASGDSRLCLRPGYGSTGIRDLPRTISPGLTVNLQVVSRFFKILFYTHDGFACMYFCGLHAQVQHPSRHRIPQT